MILRHVARNALLPVVTMLGLQFGSMLGGGIVVEGVFAIPGVGRLALDGVGSQEDFSQAPKFRETRSGKTHWSPVYFRSGVQPYVTLAVPVGQYAVEVTTAEISLKAVQRAIAQVQAGRGGYAYVVDSRGRMFAHPDIGLVRQNRDLSGLPQVRDARAARPDAVETATVAEGLQGGQILAAVALLGKHANPTDRQIDEAMTNLCRCGTYARVRSAIRAAAKKRT